MSHNIYQFVTRCSCRKDRTLYSSKTEISGKLGQKGEKKFHVEHQLNNYLVFKLIITYRTLVCA